MREPSQELSPGTASQESEPSGPRAADGSQEAPQSFPATAQPGQYLTFRVGHDEYAVGVLQVREILEFTPLTPIPLTPPWIRGVLNLRGNVVPVVELALKFGLEATETTDRTCIVIVEVELDGDLSPMGVIVDSVSEVVDFGDEEIEPTPHFGTRVRVDYLAGMGKFDGRLIPLLDTDRVLSTEELMLTFDALPADRVEQESGEAG